MPSGVDHTRTLNVGDKAPDFTLKSHLGTDVTLSDYRGQNVLLAFYPYDWSSV